MNNDWIKHDGKGCPIRPEQLVRVKRGDGSMSGVCKAQGLLWSADKGVDQRRVVTEYQVVTENE